MRKRYRVIFAYSSVESEVYNVLAYSKRQAKLKAFMKYTKGTGWSFKRVNTERKRWMKDRRVRVL